MRSMVIHTPELEDVPEVLHRIQSLLPLEAAARTCVLSKSWLRAWSTIPTLRFWFHGWQLIDRTLLRYLQDNIPIESFNYQISCKNLEWAERWILPVISKSCFKKLLLIIAFHKTPVSLKLPDEIFSGENVNEINVSFFGDGIINSVSISSNIVIKCVSLRVLKLHRLKISEEVLNNLLPTCSLLEIINLSYLMDLKTCKLKHLCYLREFGIISNEKCYMEIGDVPNLHSMKYKSFEHWENSLPFNKDSFVSVKHLELGGMIINAAFFDMIKLKFPSLESLTLIMKFCLQIKSFDVRSLSLKRFTLKSSSIYSLNIQVYAPKLLIFGYDCWTIPSLSFPAFVPRKVELKSVLRDPNDHSFYLKMRDTLNVSSKFDIEIDELIGTDVVVNIDIKYLRRKVSFPATNVEKLLFKRYLDGHSQLLDAFFSICHPNYFKGYQDPLAKINSNSCKLLVRDMMGMEKRMSGLKGVEIKNPYNGKWEVLTSCWSSSLYTLADSYSIEFKLNW